MSGRRKGGGRGNRKSAAGVTAKYSDQPVSDDDELPIQEHLLVIIAQG